jgi:hypothetical protein
MLTIAQSFKKQETSAEEKPAGIFDGIIDEH